MRSYHWEVITQTCIEDAKGIDFQPENLQVLFYNTQKIRTTRTYQIFAWFSKDANSPQRTALHNTYLKSESISFQRPALSPGDCNSFWPKERRQPATRSPQGEPFHQEDKRNPLQPEMACPPRGLSQQTESYLHHGQGCAEKARADLGHRPAPAPSTPP